MSKVDDEFLEVCNRATEDLLTIRRKSQQHLSEGEHLVLSNHLDFARIGIKRLIIKLKGKKKK